MSVQTVLYDLLNGISVSIYPVKAKQSETGDYVVFRKVSQVPTETKDSMSAIDEYRWQFDIHCSTLADCETVSGEIRTILDGHTDMTENIKRIRFENSTQVDFSDSVDTYTLIDDYKIEEHK